MSEGSLTVAPPHAGGGERGARVPLGAWGPWLADLLGTELDATLRCLRPEDEVMVPEALRAMPATRASFAHSLLRRMSDRRWSIARRHLEIDADGCGIAVYEVEAEGVTFHFGAFSHPPDEARTGRIRENEFDFFGAILDGPVDMEALRGDHEAFAAGAWGARASARTIGWTVANRSVRLFDHVVDCLARGAQPDAAHINENGGYLIRNAGWYGNGRAGTRAWRSLPAGHPLAYPYHVDVLSLYLWRIVGPDVAEAAARARNPDAAGLSASLERYLGVGNSSGIGTVAALVRWPAWLSSYVVAREVALAYARSRPGPIEPARVAEVLALLRRAARFYAGQPARHLLFEQPADVAGALERIADVVGELAISGRVAGSQPELPWLAVSDAAGRCGSREASEQLNAILIDAYPEQADAIATLIPRGMRVERAVHPERTVGELRALVGERYRWALQMDLDAPGAREYFWYRSEENGENRRGVRALDPGAERETFVDVAGVVQRLARALDGLPDGMSVGRFLLEAPEHALAVSRVQLAGVLPYTEIRANLLGAEFHPGEAIRLFLSVLGFERPDAQTVQWVRGTFFQGAPLAENLTVGAADDWMFPVHAG